MACIKPPMYSVGIIPVLVGGALQHFLAGGATFAWGAYARLLIGAVLVIAWLNLSNDGFDAFTGVDSEERKPESIVNLTTGSGTTEAAAVRVLIVAKVLLAAGVWCLSSVLSPLGDPRPAYMLALSILCGYVYQGPPFRLSYKGVGELLCFVAFGPSATTAFYLALRGSAVGPASALAPVPQLAWCLAGLVGITTSVILFCSHFHQVAGDIAAGKRSPVVRLGTSTASKVLAAFVTLPYVALGATAAVGALPLTVPLAALLSGGVAWQLASFGLEHHAVPARVRPLKIIATKWHMAFGASLCLGLGLQGWLPV